MFQHVAEGEDGCGNRPDQVCQDLSGCGFLSCGKQCNQHPSRVRVEHPCHLFKGCRTGFPNDLLIMFEQSNEGYSGLRVFDTSQHRGGFFF